MSNSNVFLHKKTPHTQQHCCMWGVFYSRPIKERVKALRKSRSSALISPWICTNICWFKSKRTATGRFVAPLVAIATRCRNSCTWATDVSWATFRPNTTVMVGSDRMTPEKCVAFDASRFATNHVAMAVGIATARMKPMIIVIWILRRVLACLRFDAIHRLSQHSLIT
jgi:hypothetical protein